MATALAKHKTINRNNDVPRVRFSEFKSPWEEVSFGSLFKFNQTNSFSRDLLNYENGEVRNIHYGDIHTKFHANFDVTQEEVPFINGDVDLTKIKNENYCTEGDLVIADASEDYADIGKAIEIRNLDNEKVVAGLHTLLARPKSDTFASGFAGYIMRTNTVRHQIKILAQGTKVLGIAPKHLSQVLFKIPKKDEQIKIVSFLETIDLWITNLKVQRKSLDQYKKGVMQKIFSQEIRFKDKSSKDFPEWEEMLLKEVLKERKTFSIKGNGYPHISLTTKGVVPKSDRYDRDFLVGDDVAKGYKITHLNDLCYNPANLKFGVISLNKLGDGIFSPIYVTFEIMRQNIDFIGYYLTRIDFINKARRYEQGTVYERMAVSPADFLKVKVRMPSLPEQEKIADYLKSIDEIIQTKERQIACAEQWKKGLMRELFI